jgi:hypothetical protein
MARADDFQTAGEFNAYRDKLMGALVKAHEKTKSTARALAEAKGTGREAGARERHRVAEEGYAEALKDADKIGQRAETLQNQIQVAQRKKNAAEAAVKRDPDYRLGGGKNNHTPSLRRLQAEALDALRELDRLESQGRRRS